MGGLPASDLLMAGARSDVVGAAQHAMSDGVAPDHPALLSGLQLLEDILADNRHDLAITLVVAWAHIDIGLAWQAAVSEGDQPVKTQSVAAAYLDRASALLHRFDGQADDSTAMAAARCALLSRLADPRRKVTTLYHRLICLDPRDPRHLRALGRQLLPNRFGTLDELDRQARRVADQTQGIWGQGGYAWVMSDAMSEDAGACERVDPALLDAAIGDILARRPCQRMVNLLTALCIRPRRKYGRDYPAARQIADCGERIIRTHLTELHPMVWGCVAFGLDNVMPHAASPRLAAQGRAIALETLRAVFAEDLARGHTVAFSADGLDIGG